MATTCPITREQFRNGAQPIKIIVNGVEMTAEVKEFKTGSFGWYLNSKATVNVGGANVTVQVGANLTIVGSKDLPA